MILSYSRRYILQKSYFNVTIDTHAEYLDTVRCVVITLPQSYVN